MSSVLMAPPPGDCVLFAGHINKVSGYGYDQLDGRTMTAHRAAYLAAGNEIPEGHDVDHVCHSADPVCPGGIACMHRRCVNPAHLEAVTRKENLRRAAARITHCPHGHEYTDANTIHGNAGRQCRTCKRAMDTRRARRLGMKPMRADFATHCARGHEYTSETLHIETSRDGKRSRRCKVCWRINAAAKRARKAAA